MNDRTTPTPISRVLGVCDHGGAILSRNAANNAIGFFCDECRSWIIKPSFGKIWIPKDHPGLRGVDLPNIPSVGEKQYRQCQGRCKQVLLCQLHHVAPRAFFGEECDEWPMVWLCPLCHARWHQLVTPGLCTGYDVEAHGKQVIRELKADQVVALARYLVDHIKAQRAGAA